MFDKDGTLFDFRGTWDVWAAGFLPKLCGGDEDLLRELVHALRFDLEKQEFQSNSIAIAGSNHEISQVIARVLKRKDVDQVEHELAESAAVAPLAPAVDLAPFLQGLKDSGYKLGSYMKYLL